MKRSLAFLTLVMSLAGCGGGGSTTPSAPVASTASFPLQNGYRALVLSAETYNFSISGSCAGTAAESVTAATTTVSFEGAPALQSTVSQQLTRTNCTPANLTTSTTTYLDPVTYLPVGSFTPGAEYVVVQGKPAPLPASVKVGDNAAVVGFNVYSDSSKSKLLGTRSATFTITADTESTATLTIITNDFEGTVLIGTQQTSYRISADGTLFLTKVDVVTNTGTHLILTRQ
ncbi:MAG: hypothetical protein ABI218_13215 [Caldimonas sp.]